MSDSMITWATGSTVYDISEDAVIVRVKIPCRIYPSHAVEKAANDALMPFIESVAQELIEKYPERKP